MAQHLFTLFLVQQGETGPAVTEWRAAALLSQSPLLAAMQILFCHYCAATHPDNTVVLVDFHAYTGITLLYVDQPHQKNDVVLRPRRGSGT